MSTHRFTVEVEVDNGGTSGDDREPADYAKSALYAVGLRDAEMLDGYADLKWTACITDVTED